MTWEEIRKRFLKELLSAEKRLEEDVSSFARRFLEKLRREGFRLTPELERELEEYVRGHEGFLRRLVELSAAKVAIGRGISGEMRDEFVAGIAEEVFRRRWADGRNLSERIWWIGEEIRRGMTETLARGVRTGASVSRLVYEMQYMIEREMGARFVQVTTEQLPKWLEDLWEAGRGLIRNRETRAVWEETVRRAEEHLERLSREGTYHATRRLISEMIRAVEAGREDLMLKALNWWLYDRQLYFLKRVARTEAANAFHLAQIRATEDDPDVIGYQWRLSRSHPRPDICDWYASVDFGLGKGVWPKDRVPRGKAHPHCMCYLLPRVTKSKVRGVRSFRELWEQLPEGQRREMLPRWASRLAHAGVDPNEFLAADGLSFRRKRDFVARLGRERFEALSAIGGALEEVKWRDLEGHVKARKAYVRNARELNAKFESVLRQKKAEVWAIRHRDRGLVRLYVLSEGRRELAILDRDGTRVSWFPLDKQDPKTFHERMKEKVGGPQEFVFVGWRGQLWQK